MPSKLIPEPGAVAGQMPATALPNVTVTGAAPWGDLSAGNAVDFTSVQPVVLPAGTVLRRVFGYPDAADAYFSWEVGSWWTRQPLPATEAEWRATFAIEAAWNGGQAVASWTIPQAIHAWVGPAAPQSGEYTNGTPAVGYYLPGGGEQIFIPASQLPLGTWAQTATPWNQPPAATATAKKATPPASTSARPPKSGAGLPPPAPTPASLARAVATLSTVLKSMSAEAKRVGVDPRPLAFQSKRVARYGTMVKRYAGPKKRAELQAVATRLGGIARHVHTQYPWSNYAAPATAALHEVVRQATALKQA